MAKVFGNERTPEWTGDGGQQFIPETGTKIYGKGSEATNMTDKIGIDEQIAQINSEIADIRKRDKSFHGVMTTLRMERIDQLEAILASLHRLKAIDTLRGVCGGAMTKPTLDEQIEHQQECADSAHRLFTPKGCAIHFAKLESLHELKRIHDMRGELPEEPSVVTTLRETINFPSWKVEWRTLRYIDTLRDLLAAERAEKWQVAMAANIAEENLCDAKALNKRLVEAANLMLSHCGKVVVSSGEGTSFYADDVLRDALAALVKEQS